MVCLHVLVGAPTEWRVRPDHHARRVLDILDRCHSPDVRHALLPAITVGSFFNRPGGAERGAPASVIQEQHAATVHQHGLVARRYRHLPVVSSIVIDIDERHQAYYCSHVLIVAAGPDAPDGR